MLYSRIPSCPSKLLLAFAWTALLTFVESTLLSLFLCFLKIHSILFFHKNICVYSSHPNDLAVFQCLYWWKISTCFYISITTTLESSASNASVSTMYSLLRRSMSHGDHQQSNQINLSPKNVHLKMMLFQHMRPCLVDFLYNVNAYLYLVHPRKMNLRFPTKLLKCWIIPFFNSCIELMEKQWRIRKIMCRLWRIDDHPCIVIPLEVVLVSEGLN